MNIFSRNNLIIFRIFADNIDCGNMLEPPRIDCGYTLQAVLTSTHTYGTLMDSQVSATGLSVNRELQ